MGYTYIYIKRSRGVKESVGRGKEKVRYIVGVSSGQVSQAGMMLHYSLYCYINPCIATNLGTPKELIYFKLIQKS